MEQDREEAAKWYHKATDQGSAMAQLELGISYLFGTGVEQDWDEAAKWFRKAAEQGYGEAQFCLAGCYLTGKGVKQDLTEAIKWLEKSAEQDNDSAQYVLGVCYYKGLGIEQDHEGAAKRYYGATDQDFARTQLGVDEAYLFGSAVEKNEDWDEAFRVFRKAAENGNVHAQYILGNMYLAGRIGGKPGIYGRNLEKAIKWYRKAADQGFEKATQTLKELQAGRIRYEGESMLEDLYNVHRDAARGHVVAQYRLGMLYETDEVVDRDLDEAAKWYGKAAAQGNKEAKQALKRLQALKTQQTPAK